MKPIISTDLDKADPRAQEGSAERELSFSLDRQKIQAALRTDGAELGICPEFRSIQPQFDVQVFESLPSTSTQVWNMLAQGAGAGTVAIAQRQTNGRGQRGRCWQSEPGGLYLSLALEPSWPIAHGALLTCGSAWGIATAFNNLGLPVQIKWPNDLFFAGKKLGGILTETKLAQPATGISSAKSSGNPLPCIKQAVIGVGINWHNQVPETAITLAKIQRSMPNRAAQTTIDCLERLTALVLKGILQGVYFQQQVGNQVFIKTYSNLLTQTGKVVSISDGALSAYLPENCFGQSSAANCSGKVMGISEEGYLRVALEASDADSAIDPRLMCKDHSNTRILLLKPSEIHVD